MTQISDIPPAPAGSPFVQGEIVLYGVRLDGGKSAAGATVNLGRPAFSADEALLSFQVSSGGAGLTLAAVYAVASGAAIQRFAEPRLLAFPAAKGKDAPAQGGGFDGLGYVMWRLSPDALVVEVSGRVLTGSAMAAGSEDPVRKAPASYNSLLAVAHRDGSLSTS